MRLFTNLASKLEDFIPSEFLEVDQDEIGRKITEERQKLDRQACLTHNAGMESPRSESGGVHSVCEGKKGVKRKLEDTASEQMLMRMNYGM